MTSRADLVARLRAGGCVWAEDEAEVLLAAASDAAGLDGRFDARLDAMVARRVAGEPLEQVVGYADFAGVRLAVAPGVFVPRRRSELLVAVATGLALRPGAVVVDLGCGTGALGVALVERLGTISVPVSLHACDLDPDAVACAARNVPAGSAVHLGDLFDALPAGLRGRVDVVLANAPYVPSAEIALLPPEAREHEHRLALDGGADGLDVHRRIAAAAPGWLRPGGTVLIEVSERQARSARQLLAAAGLAVREHADPSLGALVLTATAPPP